MSKQASTKWSQYPSDQGLTLNSPRDGFSNLTRHGHLHSVMRHEMYPQLRASTTICASTAAYNTGLDPVTRHDMLSPSTGRSLDRYVRDRQRRGNGNTAKRHAACSNVWYCLDMVTLLLLASGRCLMVLSAESQNEDEGGNETLR